MVKREIFGLNSNNQIIDKFTLIGEAGVEVEIITLGAVIRAIRVPNELDEMVDIVLGYDTPQEYLDHNYFFGAMIGRNSNRIENARFQIGDTEFQLEKNDGENNLHSGAHGMHQKLFQLEEISQYDTSVTLSCVMEHLEDGFPGRLVAKICYQLTSDNTLNIDYTAICDQNTIINFTNHSYFNLSGHDSGNAEDQEVKIYADAFTPIREIGLIPTGEIRQVEHTPMDFRVMKAIELDIDDPYPQLTYCGGYDHNYAITGEGFRIMAEAKSGKTGIHMIAFTDCPGMQFYAGNFISSHTGKNKAVYGNRSGYCFESQQYPNAVNCEAFPDPVQKADTEFRSRTSYQFLT
ncbi:MAG: aldose epimerase family protein [Lachnospiraceae bacterium]